MTDLKRGLIYLFYYQTLPYSYYVKRWYKRTNLTAWAFWTAYILGVAWLVVWWVTR